MLEKEIGKSKIYINNIYQDLESRFASFGLFFDKIEVVESSNEYVFYIKLYKNNKVIFASPKLASYKNLIEYINILVNTISGFRRNLIDNKII